MTGRLQDKVVLVTGAGTGIGAAISERFVCEGARVVVNVPQAGPRIESASQRNRVVVVADVSNASEVNSMIEEVHEKWGLIDVLINNAGVYPRCRWSDMDEAKWDLIVDVNLKGQFLCAHACYEDMVKQGYGKIINVSSNTVLVGKRDLVHYISAKAGVVGLTRALARELGEFGICVNCIIPGGILVQKELELYPDQENVAERLFERQCIKRRGTPADLEGLFVFLASHESDFITGQSINIDGGWALY